MIDGRFSELRRKLLWVDCIAGLVVGLIVLLLDGWLSRWYNLPQGLVFSIGVVNLVYGTYSFSLALRRKRPMNLIRLLVVGNLLWTVICVGLVLTFFNTASPVGLVVLLGEGLFVGGLALLEWQSRTLLLTARAHVG